MVESDQKPTENANRKYLCYGECGSYFDTLEELTRVVGSHGDARHYCNECVDELDVDQGKA